MYFIPNNVMWLKKVKLIEPTHFVSKDNTYSLFKAALPFGQQMIVLTVNK